MTFNILFFILAIILLGCIIRGYKEGALAVLIDLFSKIVILITVLLITPYITTYLLEKETIEQPRWIVMILVFCITYGLFLLVFKILSISLDFFAKLPLLKEANKVLGILAGCMQWILSVWIFMAIVYSLSFWDKMGAILVMIQENEILKALYDNNLVLFLIRRFLKIG